MGIYTVDLYLKVRHAHFQDGLSGRQIARDFGISRDSVAKMLAYSEPPGYRRTAPIRRPKLDAFTSQMDQWLAEDRGRPRKQRHTAKRIFERLRDECGFDGSYTIVKDYVRDRKRTGKELFARLIHSRLGQPDAPYVPVNCAAVSGDLIGAELFGYVDGAFTGAVRGGRPGKFEQADGGLLCLDEIGDMPIELQPYLLRALEQRAIYRMGDNKRRPVDVRLVAMTNRDLRLEIDKGTFRRDLFYRIGVVTIEVPPLRERDSDILPLIEHFSAYYANQIGRARMSFADDTIDLLLNYRWPGNVRELRNTVQRIYLVGSGPVVTRRDLPPELRDDFDEPEADSLESILSGNSGDLESIEASAIRRTILAEKGNLTRVAGVLGISRPTLYRKMRQYRIERG